jgi:glutamine amidotransferase
MANNMHSKVVIIDCGMGNLFSVKKKFRKLGGDITVTSNPAEINNADKIVLPGVGHFGKAMDNLRNLNLLETLNENVLIKKKPILGICLGMQLMAKKSEEGNAEGLGWFDADVVHFNVSDKLRYKIPHTGWNQITNTKESMLMKGIPDSSEFYFVHSYHFKCNNQQDILNLTDYEYSFPSAVEKDNIFGVQYHPEKSHELGVRLLNNFIAL